jgi:hypothetical protein
MERYWLNNDEIGFSLDKFADEAKRLRWFKASKTRNRRLVLRSLGEGGSPVKVSLAIPRMVQSSTNTYSVILCITSNNTGYYLSNAVVYS